MKKTNVFWILAVVIMVTVLASCQKLELATEVKTSDGLFLKSAAVGETAVVNYFKDGKIDQFSYPDNILFKVSGKKAEILSRILLVIRDFNVLDGEEEAFFLVGEVNSKPIIMGQTDGKTLYDMNLKNVHANKIPFTTIDYGLQTNEANGRFNGLLKSENYVLAINSGTSNSAKILIYDLRTGMQTSTTGSIQNDALAFKVGQVNWVLKFVGTSPVGNIFKLTIGDVILSCYTLS